MLLERVGTRLVACRQAVVDVPPMIGRDCCRIDVERFDGVDELEYVLDLLPTFELEPDVTARAHEWPRLIGLALRHGQHDVEIGRETCRGIVCTYVSISVVGVSLKKK